MIEFLRGKRQIMNKCTICGKFIAVKDFESGEAYSHMVLPESDLSVETYEIVCKRCNNEKKPF